MALIRGVVVVESFRAPPCYDLVGRGACNGAGDLKEILAVSGVWPVVESPAFQQVIGPRLSRGRQLVRPRQWAYVA